MVQHIGGLPRHLIDYFSHYFDRSLLDKISIWEGLPRFVRCNPFMTVDAYTTGYRIYFRNRELYDPHTIGGVRLIAHEVEHVRQYEAWGTARRFQFDYVWKWLVNLVKGMGPTRAYENIPVEIAAVLVGDIIKQDIEERLRAGQNLLIP